MNYHGSDRRWHLCHYTIVYALFACAMLHSSSAHCKDWINILDFAPPDGRVDRTGGDDVSRALAAAVAAANTVTSGGEPTCVYLPPGIYRIETPPPQFVRAGCIRGDGPSQAIISLDPKFSGDLFVWSEAWAMTTSGPTVAGLTILGSTGSTNLQNALVFYDRNDQVFIDNIDIMNLHGRALYSGATMNTPQAYMRESHMRSLRFFNDGAPGVPVVEFNSQGPGDATNEVHLSQVDVYGARGPSVIIRNNGKGDLRSITIDAMRIEGNENGTTQGDLLTIGDSIALGSIHNITINNLELIDPANGYNAFHLIAPEGSQAPYQITVSGYIGGGVPYGQGICIDAGRTSTFRLSGLHTFGTNVVIGRGITGIVLDGGGQEASWTYSIDPTSANGVSSPALQNITWPRPQP